MGQRFIDKYVGKVGEIFLVKLGFYLINVSYSCILLFVFLYTSISNFKFDLVLFFNLIPILSS